MSNQYNNTWNNMVKYASKHTSFLQEAFAAA